MRAFRDRPIGQKLALIVATASIAGTLLAAAAVTAYDSSTFRPRAVRDATTLAELLAANTVPTLLFDDSVAARENLATLRNRPEIAAAGVYRRNGARFASYQRDGGPAVLATPPSRAGLESSGDLLVLTQALESDRQLLGWIRLQYELPTFRQRLPQYAVVAVVVLVAVGATALLLFATLGQFVAQPLQGLADTVSQLTATGDLTLRVPRHADDEIGALTAAFNRMVATLQASETALEAKAAALRESEAQLRLALTAAEMETWVLRTPSPGRVPADAVPGDGAPGDGALQKLLDDVHPDDRAKVERAIAEATAGRTGFEIEFRVRGGTEERVTALRGQAFADSDGAPAQFLGVAQDVTERRRLERQLLQAQKMEAIGNLAGGIAHDFNNLLTGMLGYLAFVQRRLRPDSPVRADVDQVERAARRAAELTSQLLSYARRQMVVPTLLDLSESVENLVPLLRRLLGEEITVRTELTPSAGPTRIDPGQLEQVIINLAINARDAMPGGGTLMIATRITILDRAAAAHVSLPPGEYAELIISDTGTGIAPEIMGRIFEPFFTTKPQGQGTGLGLAVCYGIVKQAGGEITVESEPGRGSRFRVLLPRSVALADPAPGGDDDELVTGTETILLVEDDAAVRQLTARMLREAGYRVLEAADGAAATALAGAHAGPIDLLLTDVVMPAQSGGALAEELQRQRPHLPVVFMSGYPDDTVATRGVLDEEAVFLAKPFSPGALTRAVREAIQGGAAPA